MTEETVSAEAGNAEAASANAEAAEATTSNTTTTPVDVPDWRSGLPDDLKESPSLSKFDTIEGLAKSYVNAEKMIGADKIVIPKEGDADAWNQVYAKLGRPEKPEEYGFQPPEKIPEGMQYDKETDAWLANVSHEIGLNKAQAAKLRERGLELFASGAQENLKAEAAQKASHEKAIADGEAALKAEWGEAFEQRGKIALKAAEANFSPETFAALEETGLANNPSVIRDLYKIGLAMQGEENLLGQVQLEQSPGDLDAAIAKFRSEKESALNDRTHAEHATAVMELQRLYEKRYNLN